MTRIASIIFIVLHALFSSCVEAQKLAPIPVEDAINTRSFGQFVMPMKFSPDGQWLAYVVTDNRKMVATAFSENSFARTGVIWTAVGTEISVINVKSGETRNITLGVGNNWYPVWSPDSKYLAFLSDRDGSSEAKLWLWEPTSGNLRKVSDIRVRTGQEMQWLPDGKGILLAVLPENSKPEDYLSTMHGAVQPQEQESPSPGLNVRVFRSKLTEEGSAAPVESDPWPLTGLPVDLVTMDIATGKTHVVLRALDRLGWYSLSPDGAKVAFSAPKRFERPGSQQILWNIDIATVALGERRSVASDVRMSHGGSTFSWSPDGSKIAYEVTGQLETQGDCYVIDLEKGTSVKATTFAPEGLIPGLRPPLWDPTGKFIYFVRRGVAWRAAADQLAPFKLADIAPFEIEELAVRSEADIWAPTSGQVLALAQNPQTKESAFYTIDVSSGRATVSMKSAHCHNCVNAVYHVVGSATGVVSYFSEDAAHPPDLWLSDAQFRRPQRLTHLNPQFDEYVMGSAQLLRWRSDDGEQLQGALLFPAGYQNGRRYPLITWVYGGDFLSDHLDRFGLGNDGPFNLQLFATRGYAVLLPDAPQHRGTPMADLAKAVLPGVNKAVEIGVADPDRVGVMGHSYGGYSTMCLLVQSNRFKAAVVSGGFGDLIGNYGGMERHGGAFGISIMEQGQGRMTGTPWEVRDQYIENSPIFYLDRVQTPILITHGSNDTATLAFLGDELFVDLRRLGKNVEYAKYVGEEHTPSTWSYADQLDVTRRWIGWFDKYLKLSPEAKSGD